MKYFGTDGIRGEYQGPVVNEDFAYSFGHALNQYMNAPQGHAAKVLLGRDTRPSGQSLMSALSMGLKNGGTQPIEAGVLPTPALAFGVINGGFDLGVMITASHNPSPDNGFKLFSKKGEKLAIHDEDFIESKLDRSLVLPIEEGLFAEKSNTLEGYIDRLMGFFPDNFLQGQKIVADLANGATIGTTPRVLSLFGAEVIAMHEGEGIINEGVGSEYPELMQKRVKETKADFGLAHDGDGDRVIFADGDGTCIHGDQVLGLLALDSRMLNELKGNGLVATEHSNSGLGASLAKKGIDFFRSQVGDRNVSLLMKEKGCNLGGESSGHVVSSNYLPTGDGLFTGLRVAHAIVRNQKSLKELARAITLWPSKVGSFGVEQKVPISEKPELVNALDTANTQLGESGRTLLRYSGTEPKIRLLVEGKDKQLVQEIFALLATTVEKIL
jgi:phosphoglucosamine mutase